MKPCPDCDAATKVYGREQVGSTIVRYRRCKNPDCGRRFKTTQSPEEAMTEDTFQHAEPEGGKRLTGCASAQS